MTDPRPRRALLAGLLALAALAGCSDDEGSAPPPPEPDVAILRIEVGNQVITVDAAGTVTGGPIIVPRGLVDLTMEFLDATDQPDPVVTPDAFEGRVFSLSETVVEPTRTGPFEFSLNAKVATTTTLAFDLRHLDPDHTDFGPVDVDIEVQGPGGE